ncbi:protein NLP3-like isoform X2 [Phoenix dactylifera]|uniref:Protein NLP3-like isoform X2 n=1 Tax=Phoenix dactylifera TaxID=42345 RepID=A0A8B7BHP8_PHODC|nr:protein NLP3-like isoform X2 [Phoenix dactylifera]
MSETGDWKPPDADSAALGRELMDFDLDIDCSPWSFDPCFSVSIPPSSFLSSSPLPTLPQLSFPPPPSPLWIFEDRAAEMSSSLADCTRLFNANVDVRYGKVNANNSQARQLPMPAVEGNADDSCVIKERMTQALRYFKESTDQHVLVQVWAPMKKGDRCFLTTSGQPFVLGPQSTRLLQYRTVSLMYIFSVDEDGEGYLGLPGRVFRHRQPEWTPNVQYYSSKEYPRLTHALHYNVQGTLALPVFDPSGQSCIGVIELIMTSQKINYAREVDKVCKALQAVNLRSSEILDHPNIQISNEGRQSALAEILEVLTVVCEAHKLPLAQAWVPCKCRTILAHGGGLKKICSSFDGSCMGQVCMSTTDVAFYVIDAHMWGFREACVEHHLQIGQGVAGRAFALRRPCFAEDVTKFSKSEYPLVHYARMFGLVGCLAICLQSTHSGDDDYVLEFFLPHDCKNLIEQQALLDSISALMKQCFRSLKVVSELELQEGISFEIISMFANENHGFEPDHICSQICDAHLHTSPETYILEGHDDSQNEGNVTSDSHVLHLPTHANAEKASNIHFDSGGGGASTARLSNKNNGAPEKRRGKAEKSISLEVLQQYFSGSLKDAAKSLGVCPTTMKRVCRQHGISRWPSRKINKVNRSLSKLKRVIESVQGAEGTFNLTSLACPLPVAVGSISWPVNLDASKESTDAVKDNVSSPHRTPEKNNQHDKLLVQQELGHNVTSPKPEAGKDSPCSKTKRSSEGSMVTPAPQGSCHKSPVNETSVDNVSPPPNLKQGIVGDSLEFTLQDTGGRSLPPVCLMPGVNVAKPQPPLAGMMIEDSGSSKDLKNLCSNAGEGCQDEHAMAANPLNPMAMQETKTVTIKASHKEDIIRFRLPCTAGIVALKDEVAKRLKLEVGTFDIKYLDDDHEWVMLACNADLEECIEMSRLSGSPVIRLAVHDIVAHLGSSYGSSGD